MLYPMFVMLLITMGYGFFVAYTRMSAVKNGEIDPLYFKTMSGYDVPEKVLVTTRHFANLMETPPLFYIAGTLMIAMEVESNFAITIGWVYVVARIIHMVIHSSYNNQQHRMLAFLASKICIIILWFTLVF